MIESYIQQINEQLRLTQPNVRMYGQAQTMFRKRTGEIEVMPCEVNLDGQASYIGIDDKFHLFTYHKVYSLNYVVKNGYGNSLDAVITHQCALVIYLNRKKMNLSADELVLLIQSRFPLTLKETRAKTVMVTLQNTILDGRQLAQAEYQDPYILIPEASLMAINYKIESTLKKGCFDTCK